MGELVVRPSTKAVKALYVFWVLIAVAILGYAQISAARVEWGLIVPGLGLVWTLVRHIGLRFTTMTITGTRLSMEHGILSRSARTLDLAKIQDVRVEQSLGQRILNLGNLTLETAGETGSLTMPNIDSPRQVADRILSASSREPRNAQM
jgi:uncharacterized membrane protein YdbT with pleckstrin-like domain